MRTRCQWKDHGCGCPWGGDLATEVSRSLRLFYLVSICLCIAVILTFQLTAFTFRENLVATVLLLALFRYTMLPWMYLLSGIFPSADVAFISYVSLNFIFRLCTLLMTTIPRLLAIISKAQCFGLLGVNRAGKNPTFRMLNSDILPSSGHTVIRTPKGQKEAGEHGGQIADTPEAL